MPDVPIKEVMARMAAQDPKLVLLDARSEEERAVRTTLHGNFCTSCTVVPCAAVRLDAVLAGSWSQLVLLDARSEEERAVSMYSVPPQMRTVSHGISACLPS